MRNQNWLTQLKHILPEETQPWVITALKQEPFVWLSLQDPKFSSRAVEVLGSISENWSPGMLALLSLGLPASSQWGKKEPLATLDGELRQMVARSFESLMKGEPAYDAEPGGDYDQPTWFHTRALPKAGLLALALREPPSSGRGEKRRSKDACSGG